MPANRETIMFVEIIPTNKQKESALVKTTQDLHGELGKNLGLVIEFIPGHGVSLYFNDTEKALRVSSAHELKMLLTQCGVKLLRTANIQGSVEVKQKNLRIRR